MKKNNSNRTRGKKKLIALGIAALLAVGLFAGCSETPEPEETTTPEPTVEAAAEEPTPEETAEIPTDTMIELNDSGAVVTGEGAQADGNDVTITGGGNYIITGTTTDGSITANAPGEDVTLMLSGANITNADGPAVMVEDAANAAIMVADGTSNALQDGMAASGDAAAEGAEVEESALGEEGAESTSEDESTDEPAAIETETPEGTDEGTETSEEPAGEEAGASGESEIADPATEDKSTYEGVINGQVSYSIMGGGALAVNGTVAQGIYGEMDVTIDGPVIDVTAVSEPIFAGGTVSINSGTVFASGTSVATVVEGMQNYILYGFDETVTAGGTISIRQDNTELYSFTVATDLQMMLYSDAMLEAGTYDIYVDDEAVGSADVVSTDTGASEDAATDDTADEVATGETADEAEVQPTEETGEEGETVE